MATLTPKKLRNEAVKDGFFHLTAQFKLENSLTRNDKVQIDPVTGYARVETILFAPGELQYTEADVKSPEYVGMHTIEPEELKKPSFLQLLKGLDVVIRHQDIDADSYGDAIIPDGQIADAWWDDSEQVVKGILVIKDKDAIQKVVNKELWGGSLGYASQFRFDGGKIYQVNLHPEHWALTNIPRDDRVRLNNEKTERSGAMTPEEEAEKLKKEEEAKKQKELDLQNQDPAASNDEAIASMQGMMNTMSEQIGDLTEAMKALAPEPADKMANEDEPKPAVCDAVMDILVNSYAVKNGIAAEELKNAISEQGMESAINTYEKAMGIAANMAGGGLSEEEKAAAEQKAAEEAAAGAEEAAAAAAEKEKEISEEEKLANEKSQKDYISLVN